MQETRLDIIIDTICNRGCQYVNTILSDSQARSQCEELESLDREQLNKVINELKSVMSVYQQTGGCELQILPDPRIKPDRAQKSASTSRSNPVEG